MSKILLHNLSIPFRTQPSDLHRFDCNALFFADAGDIVIIKKDLPDKTWYSFLVNQSLIQNGINLMIIDTKLDHISIFSNDHLLEALKKLSKLNKIETFDVFMPTEHECELAQKLQLPLPAPHGQYEEYMTKSSFRMIAKSAYISITPGSASLKNHWSIIFEALKLYIAGAKEIIIKHDSGVSGLATRRMRKFEFFKKIITLQILPRNDFEYEKQAAYVVEKWYENVSLRPSAQCYIDDHGYKILSFHNQLMRSNLVSYSGCQSVHWLTPDVYTNLEEQTQSFLYKLHGMGFRGHVALNAIVADGVLYFTEINPRRAISSYAFQVMKNLGFSKGNLPPYSLKEIQNSSWRGYTAADMLTELKEKLYDHKRGYGVFPLDCKLLEKEGVVMMMSIASTREEVDKHLADLI